jgi:hypothetical protein
MLATLVAVVRKMLEAIDRVGAELLQDRAA